MEVVPAASQQPGPRWRRAILRSAPIVPFVLGMIADTVGLGSLLVWSSSSSNDDDPCHTIIAERQNGPVLRSLFGRQDML